MTDLTRNTDAERILIGHAMLDEPVAQLVATLPEEYFTDDECIRALRAIKRLIADHKVPDLAAMAGLLAGEIPADRLIRLMETGTDGRLPEQTADILRQCWQRRIIIQTCTQVATSAHTTESVEDLEAMMQTAMQIQKPDAKSMNDIMLAMMDTLAKKPQTMQTGIAALDDIIGGFSPGQLIYVGARPGTGKTAMGIAIATHIARHSGAVLFDSLEMTAEEIATRMIAAESGVDMGAITARKLDYIAWGQMSPAIADLAGLPIYCRTLTTPRRIMAEAIRIRAKEQLSLIVVDYVQLLRGDTVTRSRYEEVSNISRDLKLMAMKLQVPVLAMCQLNRQSEANGRKTKTPPTMSEARDSGSLEQDANIFITLYEPEEPTSTASKEWQLYHMCQANSCQWQVLTVEKNRQGRRGKANIGFDAPHMRYKSFREEEESGNHPE